MLKYCFVCILFGTLLYSEDLLFITNMSNGIETLGTSELRLIYLKKRRFWKETKLVPLNLPPDNKLRKRVENNVLHMPALALDEYWMKEHYLGHRPPYRVDSVKGMILFVKKVKGAIGYIPESKLVPGVKVVYRVGKQ
ncbi:hypothetical protein [Sulfurovum riftiae]|uniref:Uncharacterized protein n=1 Tax=Sulfurovum riftiae TaxID=1630136 RepID=A0A151CE91_9BACT|nr:hypothetical protein [Sulfurovum riftiae]KYJ85841.1 hypothetical protein AS592_04420 [Sulfurovum riftiae]